MPQGPVWRRPGSCVETVRAGVAAPGPRAPPLQFKQKHLLYLQTGAGTNSGARLLCMNAFSDIDSLLRVISRKKDILRFLFVSRKAPSLRPEQALENFLEEDSPRLEYLLDHGVVREAEGVLVLEDTYLRFFEEVLEVNEEINVLSVKQHIDALSENIELWLTKWQEAIDFLETNHPPPSLSRRSATCALGGSKTRSS